MDNMRNDDYDYNDFDERDHGTTTIGLPPSQLAIIIGVNAVIALVISIIVILLSGRQFPPGSSAETTTESSNGTNQTAQLANAPATGEVSPANPTPQPQITPVETVTYVVGTGENLTLIAQKFSVSVFDLMMANGLSDEDFIQAGQELVIPLGGLPDMTPTFTPVPFPTETPLAFDPPTPLPAGAQVPPEPAATVGPSPTPTHTPGIRNPTALPTSTPAPFDEINVTISEVINPENIQQETLVLFNKGATTNLKNWKLEGSPLAVVTLPDITLYSGGSIRIHTVAGENTSSDLYLGQSEAAWPPGTNIILSDDKNFEVSTFTVPAP